MRPSLIGLAFLAGAASASYVLEDDYSGDSFAGQFDFFTGNDPTNGYVNYLSYDQATTAGLYKTENGAVYMGVDATNVATGRGRDSVRLSTKKTYNHGLVILDLAHMPGGACGTWPAFWMLGPNWPINGEIDIIEGVNSQSANTMTLHTNAGCSITSTGAFSGSLQTANCDTNAANQPTNAGCAIQSQDNSNYGSGFNANGGGVYATEWTSEAISIWFFPRSSIPSDISSGNPDPSNWGLPQGQFTGGCDIDEHVKDQQLVFDVTFCGDWAGNVWSTDATCSSQASTCTNFVQNNPSAFQDTYWLINSLKVYNENGAASTQTATSTATSATTSQTATQTSLSVSTIYVIATSSAATSTESSPTTETTSNTIFTFTEAVTSVPTTPPTTFVTFTASSITPSVPTVTPTVWTSTWGSSPGSWNSWNSGASWPTGSWQGGNPGGNPPRGGGGNWNANGGGGWQ